MDDRPLNVVFDCYCGHEWVKVRKYDTIGLNEYWIKQCPMCFRRHQIKIGSRTLKKAIRNLVYDSKKRQWVPAKEYCVNKITDRIARAHYFNVKVLGTTLSNMMLHKAMGDYWNEVKGHWKYGSRPEWSLMLQ